MDIEKYMEIISQEPTEVRTILDELEEKIADALYLEELKAAEERLMNIATDYPQYMDIGREDGVYLELLRQILDKEDYLKGKE